MNTARKYVEVSTNKMTLSEGARRCSISIVRFSRLVKVLRLPVERAGFNILVTPETVTRVRQALRKNEVRRGRPRKKKRLEVSS